MIIKCSREKKNNENKKDCQVDRGWQLSIYREVVSIPDKEMHN